MHFGASLSNKRKDWGQEEKDHRGWKWLDGIMDLTDMGLGELWSWVIHRDAYAHVHMGSKESDITQQQN